MEDFSQIKDCSDEEGKLIYVVDGLDPDAGDVRHPGDYIEDEMIPYIERALSGENVCSKDIVDKSGKGTGTLKSSAFIVE